MRGINTRLGVPAAVLAISLVLAGCSSRDKQRHIRNTNAAPVPTAGMSEKIWKLRVGLNVAALSCRGKGRRPVDGPYRTLLNRHKALFAATYSQEQRRLGASNFDRAQTRLYNRFANQRSPQKFCKGASRIARRAASMTSHDLVPASRKLSARLENRLR